VVKEDLIAALHVIAHEISRLIVSNAVPGLGLLRLAFQIVDTEIIGFGFNQPVTQLDLLEISGFIVSSLTRAALPARSDPQ